MRGAFSQLERGGEMMILLKIIAVLSCYAALSAAASSAHDASNEFDSLRASFVANSAFSSAPFHLSDWMRDNGSGGFPEGFDDEHRRLDDRDQSPDENQIQ
jgi:hypothetical protein